MVEWFTRSNARRVARPDVADNPVTSGGPYCGIAGVLLLIMVVWLDASMAEPPDSTAGRQKLTDMKLDPASDHALGVVPELIEIARDRNQPGVERQQAVLMLGRIGGRAPDGIACLIELLDETEPTPQDRRVSAGNAPVANQQMAQTVGRDWALKALGLSGRAGGSAVPRLAVELADGSRSWTERNLIADVLGQIGTGVALQSLARELQRQSSDVPQASVLKQTMIDAIALSGPEGIVALPALIRSLADNDSEVRRKSCRTIGSMGPRAELGMDSLVDRLVLDSEPAVQDAAAEALVRIGAASAGIMVSMLSDAEDSELRWRAAWALGQLGPQAIADEEQEAAIAALASGVDSADQRVRIESLAALAAIRPATPALATMLLRELESEDREQRFRASRLLADLEPLPAAVQQTLQSLAQGDSQTARSARWILRERGNRSP